MIKKIILLRISLFSLIAIMGFAGLQAQSKKEIEHKAERLKADAWALVYQQCLEDISVYQISITPDDRDLITKARSYSLTLRNLKRVFDAKYHADSATFKKFEKEKEYAHESLKICGEYQKILDAKAEQEAENEMGKN